MCCLLQHSMCTGNEWPWNHELCNLDFTSLWSPSLWPALETCSITMPWKSKLGLPFSVEHVILHSVASPMSVGQRNVCAICVAISIVHSHGIHPYPQYWIIKLLRKSIFQEVYPLVEGSAEYTIVQCVFPGYLLTWHMKKSLESCHFPLVTWSLGHVT